MHANIEVRREPSIISANGTLASDHEVPILDVYLKRDI